MLAWNPGTDQVEVGPWPDKTQWSDRYECTAIAETQLGLLCEAVTMVMVDRVDAQAAHRELLKLDEYRASLAPDAL